VKTHARFWIVAILLHASFSNVSPALAQDCARCHPEEAARYAGSAHAHSLQRPEDSKFFRALPQAPIGEARGGFLVNYNLQNDVLRVQAARGAESATASIAWIFGAGHQAETPVAVFGTTFLEHRVSYYATNGRFGLTIGHQGGISRSAENALGRTLDQEEVKRCFGCHATGGLPEETGFTARVSCERCHPGAREHAEGKGSVSNPGRLNAKALVHFCAVCHRDQPEGNADAPINIRYQAVRLMRSKCFQGGSLSCVTCHDPHANVASDAAFYRERCLSCHQTLNNHQTAARQRDCIECHMPRSSPLPHLAFTDHYIRVR
jgi:hypothetical protein